MLEEDGVYLDESNPLTRAMTPSLERQKSVSSRDHIFGRMSSGSNLISTSVASPFYNNSTPRPKVTDDTQSVKSLRSVTSGSVYSSASTKQDVNQCKEQISKALCLKRDVSELQ